MPQVDPVILQLRADLADYQAKLSQAQRLSDQRLGAIERRGVDMTKGLSRSFNLAAGAALTFVSGIAAADIAREFLRITDTAKSLEAQLRLATRETGNFAKAQEDVRRIAGETRAGLEDTAKLYGNFQRNARDLGISQEEAARATETVAKTFKISGASAEEAGQSTRQLVQALQSGTLRGDEFNSVMEAAPRLSRLLADSLGVSVGELRKMAEEGRLTSAALVKAFTDKRYTDAIDAEFRQLPVTFADAMTQVENAAIITFGAFDRGGQFSQTLANFIVDGSNGFADLEKAAESFGSSVSAEFVGIIALAKSVIGAVNQIGAELRGVDAALGGLPGKFFEWQGRVASEVGTYASLINPITPLRVAGNALRNTPAAAQARQQQAANLTADAQNQRVNAALRWDGRQTNASAPSRAPTAPTAKATGRKGPSAETLANRAEAERVKAIRDELAARRDSLSIEDEIASAREALLIAEKDIVAASMSEIDRKTAMELAEADGDRQLKKLSDDAYKVRVADINTLSDLHKQRVQQLADERQRERQLDSLRDARDTLQTETQLARTRGERRDIEQQILEYDYKIESAKLEESIAAGKIADASAARANLEKRRAVGEELLRRDSMSPGERYFDDLQSEAENLSDAYEGIAVRGLERMSQGFADAAKNALGLHGILGDIIGDLIEMAIRQQVLGMLGKALFGGLGGGFDAGALTSSTNATIGAGIASFNMPGRASGGPVSAGRMYRVNEGASPGRVEGFIPQGAGQIVPLGRMNAAASRGGPVNQHITIRVDANGAVLASQVQQMVARGMQMAAQIGVNGGGAEGERRVMSRGKRRLPG